MRHCIWFIAVLSAGCGSRIDSVAEAITAGFVYAINDLADTDANLPCQTEELVCGDRAYQFCRTGTEDGYSKSAGGTIGTDSVTYMTFATAGGIKGGSIGSFTDVYCMMTAEFPYDATTGKISLPMTIPDCDAFICNAGADTYGCEEFKTALAKVSCTPSVRQVSNMSGTSASTGAARKGFRVQVKLHD